MPFKVNKRSITGGDRVPYDALDFTSNTDQSASRVWLKHSIMLQIKNSQTLQIDSSHCCYKDRLCVDKENNVYSLWKNVQKEVHISLCSSLNVTVLCILPHCFHIAIEAALCSLINMFPELVPPSGPARRNFLRWHIRRG